MTSRINLNAKKEWFISCDGVYGNRIYYYWQKDFRGKFCLRNQINSGWKERYGVNLNDFLNGLKDGYGYKNWEFQPIKNKKEK